uniref:Uncharacterized protein n=1 Tax=Arion vulgaris TaxID=1028688 RepID=A0A0B6ZZ94_9EUPU
MIDPETDDEPEYTDVVREDENGGVISLLSLRIIFGISTSSPGFGAEEGLFFVMSAKRGSLALAILYQRLHCFMTIFACNDTRSFQGQFSL